MRWYYSDSPDRAPQALGTASKSSRPRRTIAARRRRATRLAEQIATSIPTHGSSPTRVDSSEAVGTVPAFRTAHGTRPVTLIGTVPGAWTKARIEDTVARVSRVAGVRSQLVVGARGA